MLKNITNHWREIFDPTVQIFLNSVVVSTQINLQVNQKLFKIININLDIIISMKI